MRTIVLIDDSPECPTEWDNWKLHSFNGRHTNYADPHQFIKKVDEFGDVHPENIGLARKLQTNLAFWLSYHEHGEGNFYLKGAAPSCPWDTTQVAGLLVYEGKPGDIPADLREANARSFLDIYNAWANGHVYGYDVIDDDGEIIESCFGFYGYEAITEAVKELGHPVEDEYGVTA